MEFKLQARNGKTIDYVGAQVMGIVNVTPDSFFSDSRTTDETSLRARIEGMVEQGATLFDVGACSTRPGGEEASEQEELDRLRWAMPIVHDVLKGRFAISVDTFRAKVAEEAVEQWDVDIVNDVYGGTREKAIFEVVNRLHAPYILTAPCANVMSFFEEQLPQLTGTQVILDPGFGFGKTLEQNYEVMRQLNPLINRFPENPMLVGISRKSMIWKLLKTDPAHALNGTSVLNTIALQAGAHILRVHDVQEAVEAVKITQLATHNN